MRPHEIALATRECDWRICDLIDATQMPLAIAWSERERHTYNYCKLQPSLFYALRRGTHMIVLAIAENE